MNTQIGRTADRAFVILSTLSKGAASVTELARELDLNRTVVARLLSTLVEHRLVSQFERKYLLSSGLKDLADGVEPELRAHIASPIINLAEALGGIVLVTVRSDCSSLVLTFNASANGPNYSGGPELGARTPLTSSAHGLVMLAHAPASILKRCERDSSATEELEEELARVRTQGWALAPSGSRLLPLREIAAPIFSTHGFADAAISLISRPDDTNEMRAIELICAAGEEVSSLLRRGEAER